MKKILCVFSLLALFCGPAAAANILFIGDSHAVSPFGWKLDELLRTVPGAKVGTYGSCGSIFHWWESGKVTPCGYYFRDTAGRIEKGETAPTPIFDNLMRDINPALVVVELGANYADIPSDDYIVNDMKKLVKKISDSGASCFWITMPDARNGRGKIPRVLQLTYKAVTPFCTYFDSTLVTKYPAKGGDGVHYWFPAGLPIAKSWAEAAFEAMTPLLRKLPAGKE